MGTSVEGQLTRRPAKHRVVALTCGHCRPQDTDSLRGCPCFSQGRIMSFVALMHVAGVTEEANTHSRNVSKYPGTWAGGEATGHFSSLHTGPAYPATCSPSTEAPG